jgi:formiminotetrahydrofolate cyclodeaminase
VLKNVLAVAARKHDSARLRELMEAVGETAGRLVELAAEDGATYAAYMQARRQRSPEVQAALRRAIESPLSVARAADGGIELCLKAASYTRGAIAADVAGAAAVLAGAVRATVCTLDANLRVVEDQAFASATGAEKQMLEMHAIRQAEAVVTAVKTASNSERQLPPA